MIYSRKWLYLVWIAAAANAWSADWPAWRGATGLGVAADSAVPTHWTRTENVRWHVALPEPTNSTPVVSGDRIFLTQARKSQNRRTLLCFDRATGKQLWESGVTYRDPDVTHPQNTYAASSPVADGKLVIAWFGSAGLLAYDRNGREVWRRDLGRQKHVWGYASSPVLHGDSVFLSFGPGDRAFLIALDKNTGKTIWQVDAPKGVGNAGGSWTAADMYGSWSTPIIVYAAGRDELVLTWPRKVYAFDPASGKILWTCDGLGDQIYPSPIFVPQGDGGIVIAPSGYGDSIMAVKAGGNGDVTSTHRIWRNPKTRSTIPSGVVSGNYLFLVDSNGIAECLELMTGKNVWANRLRGSGDDNGIWSSLVLNEGKIYAMNKSAEVFLFKAAPQFELLGSSALNEETNSSLVISDGEIFIRTFNTLWCIGKTKN